MAFTPLHINSTYTFLSSALTLDKLFKKVNENKCTSLALTDFNSLVGSVTFFNRCKKENIKPIIGLDLNIDDNLFTFLVKNEEGYSSLLHLSKLFSLNKLNKDNIKGHTNGLIAIISSQQSKLLEKYKNDKDTKFAVYLKSYFDLFSDFYIGLEIYNEEDRLKTKSLREFLIKRDYKCLAFPLIRYVNKEDEIIYQLAQAIKYDKHFEESYRKADGIYYFRSEEEINKLYEKEDIENTSKIINDIDFNLIKKRGKLIKFCNDSDNKLTELANKLLSEKVKINKEYQDRLNYELDVIKKMGYSDYFLIVMDYVKFAKDNGIYVGPGRGSAGGSLVAYALNITTVDPIENGLLFERFLNEGRNTMPDIDVDFEDTRRDEVVNYIRNKYGNNKVGNIITSQTIKAKQALRDIGRVYNIRDSYINTLCKAVGDEEDLHNAYRVSPTFKKIVNSDPYYLFIVTMASKIEGFPRQAGMHAAGVIINDDPLDISLPVYIDSSNNYLSQLEKDDLESLGFLKMDILGLRNLSVIKNIITEVNKTDKTINYNNLPYNSPEALKLIAKGETLGIFQLEKPGMIKTIKEINPTSFDDIVTIISIHRPGPMQFISQYAKRKKGLEKVIYPSNKIIEILKPTYGIIIYQEQIMQIVRVMANFSYSEADLFRRAISKKDASKLIALKTKFIEASIKNGNSQKESDEVFDLIYKFANYGFNKSHGCVYAKIATQMAYLKAKFPGIFYCASLDNGANFHATIAEMRRNGIKLALPDINKSSYKYKAIDKEVIIPLTSIKGILYQAVDTLIKERDKNGEYKNFIDFVTRAIKNKVTATTIIKLIDSGSFDNFNKSRASLRESLDKVISYAKLLVNQGNQLLIDDSLIPLPKIKEIKDDEIYNVDKEYESLGVNISKSPLDFYEEDIKKEKALRVSEAIAKNGNTIVGIIKSIRRIKTKKDGKTMAFITLSDNIEDITLTVFNDIYNKYEEPLYSAKIIIANGKIDTVRNEFIAKDIKVL